MDSNISTRKDSSISVTPCYCNQAGFSSWESPCSSLHDKVEIFTFHFLKAENLPVKENNPTSLSIHFLTIMSSEVMSLILYMMLVADSCASLITPTIVTL